MTTNDNPFNFTPERLASIKAMLPMRLTELQKAALTIFAAKHQGRDITITELQALARALNNEGVLREYFEYDHLVKTAMEAIEAL